MNKQSNSIVADRVSKLVNTADGNLSILHELSFQIEQGESVAIVGASGSGKSTLLSLLAGLDLPSAGQIDLMGQNLNLLDEDGRARLRGQLVGFVFQSFQLLPHLTALENVMLPLEIAGISQAQARLSGLEWLEKVGLTARASHFPKTLSGGEQQRVAVARALINRPKIIFADEPSGNLDTASAENLHQLFFKLRDEYGQTFVIVTHNADFANMADRKLVMVDGQISSQ